MRLQQSEFTKSRGYLLQLPSFYCEISTLYFPRQRFLAEMRDSSWEVCCINNKPACDCQDKDAYLSIRGLIITSCELCNFVLDKQRFCIRILSTGLLHCSCSVKVLHNNPTGETGEDSDLSFSAHITPSIELRPNLFRYLKPGKIVNHQCACSWS